jgi:hypothetical protein
VLAYFDRPGTSNRPTEAINSRLEHLRGSAFGFRNLTNDIARSLRPLIYDSFVSAAITRLPIAPLLPLTAEQGIKVRASKYDRYCEWAGTSRRNTRSSQSSSSGRSSTSAERYGTRCA